MPMNDASISSSLMWVGEAKPGMNAVVARNITIAMK